MGRAVVVAGLGFGDEGKGSIVDWLVRTEGAGAVVRYNGGPQAAHHVVTGDGRTHCFAQFGAGTLVPGTRTHLSRFMLVDPLALAKEADALAKIGAGEAFSRLTVDPRCVVVTPFHALVNRLQELSRGAARHGSCGRGVAQAQLDAERGGMPVLRVGDLADQAGTQRILKLLWQVKVDLAEQLPGVREVPEMRELFADLQRPERVGALADAYASIARVVTLSEALPAAETLVFEGAQGGLLDRHHGFWPHVTPSITTFANALELLSEAPSREVLRVGVLRAYATRHGAGPLPTEDVELTKTLPDRHNGLDPWQGAFRVGWFDGPLARYALEACGGVDELAITSLDRLPEAVRVATSYEGAPEPHVDGTSREERTEALRRARPAYVHVSASGMLDLLESKAVLGRRIDILANGPTAGDRRRRMRAG